MRCQKGDIAIVVSGRYVGVMVEILEWVGHYEPVAGPAADDVWFVRSLCSYRFVFACGDQRDCGYAQDKNIRPLKPGADEEVEQRQRVDAHV